MKEYLEQAECLRRRIQRKINEIHVLRQRAEGMNGSGISDMPRTASPSHNKMECTVFKIMALEQEVKEAQAEYDAMLSEMETRISMIDDTDARDLLTKRFLEFKSWKVIAEEFGYSVQHIYRLRDKALEKMRVDETCG